VKEEIFTILKEILTEEELYILLRRNGFYDYKEATLRELGNELNKTAEAIRKREEKILNKIKSNRKIKMLNPYI
jgi:DNA-directed RNA polymerase sigma subunit (sigma70/sigma32)